MNHVICVNFNIQSGSRLCCQQPCNHELHEKEEMKGQMYLCLISFATWSDEYDCEF